MTDEPCRIDLRAWELIQRVLPPMPKKLLEAATKRIEKDL